MKHKMVIRAITIAGLLATLAASVVAGTPVRLTFRDTTIASGSTLSYPIHVDSSLSGYTVSSYQIQFNYNTSLFKFVGATAVGTIAATWGTPSEQVDAEKPPHEVRMRTRAKARSSQ